MRLQKLFITTLLSVSIIGTAIPANVSAASYATTKRTYTLKVAGKKQKKKARGVYLLKTIGTSLIYLKIYEILVSSFQKYKFHQNQYLLKSSVTPLRSHRSGLHYVHLIQS